MSRPSELLIGQLINDRDLFLDLLKETDIEEERPQLANRIYAAIENTQQRMDYVLDLEVEGRYQTPEEVQEEQQTIRRFAIWMLLLCGALDVEGYQIPWDRIREKLAGTGLEELVPKTGPTQEDLSELVAPVPEGSAGRNYESDTDSRHE